MAALRYSDGVSMLTLFEMSAKDSCMTEGGCGMAATGQDLVMSRVVGNVTVTAVGNVDSATLKRFIGSLQ
jgi:negative regulator of sigma E activity